MNTQQAEDFVDKYGWTIITILWIGSFVDTGNILYLITAGFAAIAAVLKLDEHRGDK